ncbi:MAG: hypothetical protein QXO19_03285 [Candidatus Aenigmatarchaeota archaeon]
MYQNKGQASMIDILILSTAISFILIYGTYFNSQAEVSIQSQSFDSIYSQALLNNIINYRINYKDISNISISELSGFYFCGFGFSRNEINNIIKNLIDKEIPSNYAYIYFSYSGNELNNLTAYNYQPTVCGKQIPISTFKYLFYCPEKGEIEIIVQLGIWPSWKKYPLTC